jgi:hypothetical protein
MGRGISGIWKVVLFIKKLLCLSISRVFLMVNPKNFPQGGLQPLDLFSSAKNNSHLPWICGLMKAISLLHTLSTVFWQQTIHTLRFTRIIWQICQLSESPESLPPELMVMLLKLKILKLFEGRMEFWVPVYVTHVILNSYSHNKRLSLIRITGQHNIMFDNCYSKWPHLISGMRYRSLSLPISALHKSAWTMTVWYASHSHS